MTNQSDDRSVCVVIPMPNDPPWELFDAISDDIPIIVCDDSNGKLAPAPRPNVTYFDYAAQEAYAGKHYAAMPHRSAASRNFGHYWAYKEGFDVIIALDYDCDTRGDWVGDHLSCLTTVTDQPAVQPVAQGGWVNSIENDEFYARGYPYEYRTSELSQVIDTTASGEVKLNMGVWDRVLDLNGVDKFWKEPPYDPGLRADENCIALGNIPVCGMNTSFAAELTPAYFFLPDCWVNGTWQLSRHDDIWGGYIIKKLMDINGDLFSWGRPVVEHTRQTPLERVAVLEQWMHLMSVPFYELVDEAVADLSPGGYVDLYAGFVDEFERRIEGSRAPVHYRAIYSELADWMRRWSLAFQKTA